MDKRSSAFSDSVMSPERLAHAHRYVKQHQGLPVADATMGEGTMHQHAYGITWNVEVQKDTTDATGKVVPGKGLEPRFVGFHVLESSTSGRANPDLAAKTKAVMVVESAIEAEREGVRTKEITGEVPMVEWLAARKIDAGKSPQVVMTQKLVDDLAAKGYSVCFRSTQIEDMLPQIMKDLGGERHVSGDLFVSGLDNEGDRMDVMYAAIRECIGRRSEEYEVVLRQDIDNDPDLVGIEDPAVLEAEKAALFNTNMEDFMASTKLDLNLSHVELLLAVRNYNAITKNGGGVGPDPFSSKLPVQIAEELARKSRTQDDPTGMKIFEDAAVYKFVQGLDWVLSSSKSNHEKKYDGLTGPERRVCGARDAMVEAQALCAGGDAAAAIMSLYEGKTGKVTLSAGNKGPLDCFGEANQRKLEALYMANLKQVTVAGIDVDNKMKVVLADAVAKLVIADPKRFGVVENSNAAHVKDRCGVAMDGAIRDNFAKEIIDYDQFGRKTVTKGLPKPPDIVTLDAALAEVLKRDGNRFFCNPEILKVLNGENLKGTGPLYEVAVGQARDAFKLVADVANWESAWHRKTEDIMRYTRALATMGRGGLEDPLAPPKPATLSFPKPTAINFICNVKGQSKGARKINMRAEPSETEGVYVLKASEEMSGDKIGPLFYGQNTRNERTTYLPKQIEYLDTESGPVFPAEEVMKAVNAPYMGKGAYYYLVNCDDKARVAAQLGLQLEGTFLANVNPMGAKTAFITGKEFGVEHAYLPTPGYGSDKYKTFEMSDKGVQDLHNHLDRALAKANLKDGEMKIARGKRDLVVEHFRQLIHAYIHEGATGVACLLPGGQTAGKVESQDEDGPTGFGQKSDILSTMVYHSESDMSANDPYNKEGVKALRRLIDMRSEVFGCPMTPFVIQT